MPSLLERTRALVKRHLEAAAGEFGNNWHIFLPSYAQSCNNNFGAKIIEINTSNYSH